MIRIWGIAWGRGTTQDAAIGAFTWRDYTTEEKANQAERDWQVILKKERVTT